MIYRVAFWLLAAAAFASAWFVPGCGDVASATDAPAKCETFLQVYCGRVLACGSELSSQQCQDAFRSVVDCGRAVDVLPSYDRCLQELPSFDCAIFDGGAVPPASCSKVFTVRP